MRFGVSARIVLAFLLTLSIANAQTSVPVVQSDVDPTAAPGNPAVWVNRTSNCLWNSSDGSAAWKKLSCAPDGNAISANSITGPGIGLAPIPWVAGPYPLCRGVSLAGLNYIAVSPANTSVTPGTNSGIWQLLSNGNTPTQLDCGFSIAQSMVNTMYAIPFHVGVGVYNTCVGLNYPTVASAGRPGVNIVGAGKKASIVNLICPLTQAMVNVPPANSSGQLNRLEFSDFTLESNALAPAIFDLHACQQCRVEHMEWLDPQFGTDHVAEFGTLGGGSTGWVYELLMRDVQINWNPNIVGHFHGNGQFTSSVSTPGGVPTITVINGGSQYDTTQLTGRLIKAGRGEACTSPGAIQFTTDANGKITAVTAASTGCAAATGLQIYPQLQVSYGVKWSNMSDSNYVGDMTVGGVGSIAAFFASNTTSQNKFYNLHPIATFNGVSDAGNNQYYSTQIDSVYNVGIDEEGQGNTSTFSGTSFQWNANNLVGSSDYLFNKTVNSPINSPAAINIIGDSCGGRPSQFGYAHMINGVQNAVIDTGAGALPAFVNTNGAQLCSAGLNILNKFTVLKVAQLPPPANWPIGWPYIISDAATATEGQCAGGGTSQMIAINNGTSWGCH